MDFENFVEESANHMEAEGISFEPKIETRLFELWHQGCKPHQVPDRLRTQTIYVAPGASQCRIYALPYPMKPGQSPSDILPQYQQDWLEIGLLNFQLNVVYLSKGYQHLREDLEGQMGGTHFEVVMK
jgi:hypothetical protein